MIGPKNSVQEEIQEIIETNGTELHKAYSQFSNDELHLRIFVINQVLWEKSKE